MERKLLGRLKDWVNDPRRKPLILRGARQVGKSYLVRQLGNEEFESMLEINFELQPQFKQFFSEPNPKEILKNIELMLNAKVREGKTLLFFDEIQECPNAIISLRYFYEQIPKLAVIAAGSLLEFTLEKEEYRSPVGRIEFLHLYPLSFLEFLHAIGEHNLCEFIQSVGVKEIIAEPIHQKLLGLYKDYVIVGGMPEAVKTFKDTNDFIATKKIQLSLIQTYRDDFAKYASKGKHKYLDKVLDRVPVSLGNKLRYSDIDRDVPSRELKETIRLLCSAGLFTKVKCTISSSLPLSYYANDDQYKIIFLDIGLALKMSGLEETILHSPEILGVFEGGLAEQFVGQELLACSPAEVRPSLYYWERNKKGSNAAIDYLFEYKSLVYPIEVKSGKTGSLKSLRVYNQENQNVLSIRISKHNLSLHEQLLSVPLYMASQTSRLVG